MKKFTKSAIAAAIVLSMSGFAMAAEGMYGASIGTDGKVQKAEAFGANTVEVTDKGVVVNAAGVVVANKVEGDKTTKAYGAFTNILNPNEAIGLVDSIFTGNSSENAGGGATIWSDGNGSLEIGNTIANSVFSGNSADKKGGALAYLLMEETHHPGQSLTVTDSTFTNNHVGTIKDGKVASEGTGGAIHAEDDLTISGTSSFTGNTATGFGGAVYATGDSVVVKLDATDKTDVITFSGNTQNYGTETAAANDIYLANVAALTVSGEGKVELLSGLAGTGSANSSAEQFYVADASGFSGAFTVNGGTTTVAGDKYFAGIVTVSGGTLQSDALQLTTASATTVSNGGHLMADSIALGKAAAANAEAVDAKLIIGGQASTGDLTFVTAGSQLTVNGELEITGKISGPVDAEGQAVALTGVTNAGTIYTDISNLIASTTSDEKTTWSATQFGAALKEQTGKVVDASYTGSYTKDEFSKLTALVGNVVFDNAQLVARDENGTETKASFEDAAAVGDVGHTGVTIAYGTANPYKQLSNNAVMGSVEFAPKPEAEAIQTVWLNGKNSTSLTDFCLTLRGDADNEVVIGAQDAEGQYVTVYANNVQFGKYESDAANVHNDLSLYGTQNAVVGTVVMDTDKTITLNSGAKLNVTGKLTTTGVDAAADQFTVSGGSVTLRGFYDPDSAIPQAKENVSTTVVTPLDYSLHINAGGASLANDAEGNHSQLVLGDKYEAAADAYAAAHEGHNFIYVGEQTTFEGALPTFENQGEVNDVVIDMSTLSSSHYVADVLGAVIKSDTATGSIGNVDQFVLQNLQGINNRVLAKDKETGKYSLNIGAVAANATVDFGTVFYGSEVDKGWWGYTTTQTADGNGVVAVEANQAVIRDFYEAGSHLAGQMDADVNAVSFGHNALSDAIVFGFDEFMSDVDAAWAKVEGTEAYQALDADAAERAKDAFYSSRFENYIEAGNTASNMAALGGAFSVGFDINDQIRSTIDRRSSLANLNAVRNASGITPWVDVMGTWNSADSLYGASGYEADIYGATLGADYTASCGAILGAAISIGQADANSVDASTKVDNDVDFWGVSLYGSHRIGNVNGKFDIGYVSTSNDLSSSSAYFGTVKESLDADIFTVGLGAEYLASVGALNVVPHAGIRWTSLDMDDSQYGADYDKMNLFQMPIGVAFSGTFDMTGWKVAPMLDISVVPTFGDKDAVANYAGGIADTVRVVDSNPVQMTLGVNASVDAWTFGVNYGLSAGSDDRLNNAFNLNARYTF